VIYLPNDVLDVEPRFHDCWNKQTNKKCWNCWNKQTNKTLSVSHQQSLSQQLKPTMCYFLLKILFISNKVGPTEFRRRWSFSWTISNSFPSGADWFETQPFWSNLHQIENLHLTDLNLFFGIEQLLVIMIIARNLSS